MNANFKFNSAEFKKLIVAAEKLSKPSKNLNIKISIQPKVAEFNFIGMVRYLEIEEENLCDVIVPFRILKAIALTQTSKNTTLAISDGHIEFNGVLIRDSSIKLLSLISSPELDLSINTPKLHLLQLKRKHSYEELQRLGLILEISKIEEEMENSLLDAAGNLAQFGITYSVLRKVADQLINESF